MKWRLILEEYGPELIYIQGKKNVVADALSRLDLETDKSKVQPNMQSLAEHFGLDSKDLPREVHPTNYKTIMHYKQKDKKLVKLLKSSTLDYSQKIFYWGRKTLFSNLL